MKYDACSGSRAENAITHVQSVAASRSIAKHTGTGTHVRRADPAKTPIAVNCGSSIKHVNSFSALANGIRYFPSRWCLVLAKQPP